MSRSDVARRAGASRLRGAVAVGLALAVLAPVFGGLDAGAVGLVGQTAPPVYTVNTTVDLPDAKIDGSCATSGGSCSLRAAVAEANATSGAQIIVPAGRYVLNNTSGTDIGDLDLRRPMTISGVARQPGPLATTIDGNRVDRVFEVLSTGIVLDGLVITGGQAGKGNGGGVLVASRASATVRRSTVTGNTATNGAGVSTVAQLVVDRSTFTGNTASGRGGGIDVGSGALTATNSTFHGNTANSGAGINSAGTARLDAVTITANRSNNSNGGGVARNGGTFTISGSILAENFGGGSPRDCSGSPTFALQNIVQNVPGCNPTGTPLIIGDPQLEPLADNGGATQTRRPRSGSIAIDAPAYTPPCVTASDQRDVSRTPPPGGRCDIGSVEVAPLTVDVSLAVTADPPTAPCPDGVTCVGVGVSSVPVRTIPTKALVATEEADSTTDATFLRRTFLRRTFLRRTFLRRTDLLASPVVELTIGDLFLRRTNPSGTSPVEQILLSDIPLFLSNGNTWDDLLKGTPFEGLPLQYITLSDVLDLPQVANLSLGEADIASTALKDLSGVALALAPLGLGDIPLGDDADPLAGWCALLDEQLGQDGCTSLGINQEEPATADKVGLVTLQLAGLDIEEVGLESIFLRRTELAGTYLESIFLRRTDLAASGIGTIFLRRTGLVDPVVDALVDCELVDCDGTRTLAEAQVAGAIRANATVANLLAYLDSQPDALDLSLLDLLLSLTQELFPGEGVAYEQIDLRATPLQNLSDPLEPPATFTATITIGGGAPAEATVVLTLPDDFEPVSDSARVNGEPIADGQRDGQAITFQLSALPVGQHALSVAARAGVDLGAREASVVVDATVGSQTASDSATTNVLVVVESFENNGRPDDFLLIKPGTINVAHISSAYDIDLYSFDVSTDAAAGGFTARIDLSNLERDYDLVLYGPRTPSLRGTPRASLQPVEDSVVGFDTTRAQLAPDVQRDVTIAPPPECGVDVDGDPRTCHPVAVAAQRGATNELIESGTLIPGRYWIQVSGFNGEFGPEPYVLRLITDQGRPLGECAPRPTSESSGPVVTYPEGVTAATATGYILVPEGRLRSQYGDTLIDRVVEGVNDVAAATGNAIVRPDADPAVKGAYDAWDEEPCSIDANNDVVREIGRLLDRLDADTPGASTVTLVGNRVMIPMGLVPDGTSIGNENTYDPGVVPGQDTSTTAALKAGYVSTDTPYAASAGILLNTAELYVPDRAVGRLVETPEQIAATLERFVTFDGVLDPTTTTSAFVTGYDFIADGAVATADAIDAQLGVGVAERTINDTWTSDDLSDGLIRGNPDIASISAHFDHNRAVPALADTTGDKTDLFRTADVAGAGNLENALVLSIGCHSGLSVPDIEVGLTDTVDWAQTYAAEGATYVGNTGYGYGDTELVAYSERLQVLLAEQLRTGASIGAAMMAAKQVYFAELAAIGPYDAKVISEWTLYGLPMWQVGGSYGPAPQTPVIQSFAAATAAPMVLEEPAPILPPDSVAQPPVELAVGSTSQPGVLSPRITDTGTYYEHNGSTIAVQYRPVQPSVVVDVSRPGRLARGVLITDASSTDINNFSPYYARPIIDQAANEQLLEAIGDAVFPTTLARVSNPVNADGTVSSTMTLAAGQFRRNVDGTEGVGTQRLFTRIDTEVTYADPSVTDFDAPRIIRTEGSVVGRTVGFTIRTAPDAERAYVLYKVAGPAVSEWAGVDLVRTGTDPVDDAAIWTGGAVLLSEDLEVEFLGQVVDGAGNVAYSVNKTSNFLAAPTVECRLESSIIPVEPGRPTPSGWYVAPDGVTVTFAAPDTLVSVDGGAFAEVPLGGVLVKGEGVHRILATSSAGSCTITVPIDTLAPTVAATADPPPNADGWHEGDVNVEIRAVDPGGSGVASIEYRINDGDLQTATGDRVVIPVTEKGDTVITASAVDAAGNRRPPITTTVKIDVIVPTVSSVITPAPNAAGWNRGPVTVDVTAEDDETGVREIRTSVDGVAQPVTPGSSASIPVSKEGETTVAYTAVDRAGNEASDSTLVKIDSTAPTISITSPPASLAPGDAAVAGFECTDAGSGVESCTARLTGPGVDQEVANGDALPTAAQATFTLTVTATDVAGNESTAERQYSVVFNVCLQYNADSPQPQGGTYVLRFQLCDSAGQNLSSSQIAVRATTIDGTTAPPPNFQGNSNLGLAFRFSSGTYIYNLDTSQISVGPHTMEFTVDGVAAPAYVLPFILR